MGMMMAVSFTRYGRLYYLDPGGHSPKVGDRVLVPTDAGFEVAETIWALSGCPTRSRACPSAAAWPVTTTSPATSPTSAAAPRRGASSKRLIKRHELPMKVVGVDYIDADNVYTVYFSALIGSTSAPWSATSPAISGPAWSCARSGRATRPACRAGSGRAGATCAARPS